MFGDDIETKMGNALYEANVDLNDCHAVRKALIAAGHTQRDIHIFTDGAVVIADDKYANDELKFKKGGSLDR